MNGWFILLYGRNWASQVAPVVENPPASAGDALRDVGSTPWSASSPGGGAQQPTPVFLPQESHG